MSVYEPIRHGTDYIGRVRGTELVPPVIFISRILSETLAQNGTQIAIDDDKYLEAISEMGLQEVVTVSLTGQTIIDFEDERHVAFKWPGADQRAETEVFVDPHVDRSTYLERRKAGRDLNRSFWLAVTVGAALAYGRGNSILAEYSILQQNSKEDPPVFLVGSLVVSIFAGIVSVNGLFGAAAWSGAELIERKYVTDRRLRFSGMTSTDFTLDKYKDEAILLMRRYPALRYEAAT